MRACMHACEEPAPPTPLDDGPAQAVADIIRTTLGPRSMLKMLLDPNGGELRSRGGGEQQRIIMGALRVCAHTTPAAANHAVGGQGGGRRNTAVLVFGATQAPCREDTSTLRHI